VSHKHHSIIHVGAGLIQFVYGLHSRLAMGVTSSRILFPPFFRASFLIFTYIIYDVKSQKVRILRMHVCHNITVHTWNMIDHRMVPATRVVHTMSQGFAVVGTYKSTETEIPTIKQGNTHTQRLQVSKSQTVRLIGCCTKNASREQEDAAVLRMGNSRLYTAYGKCVCLYAYVLLQMMCVCVVVRTHLHIHTHTRIPSGPENPSGTWQ